MESKSQIQTNYLYSRITNQIRITVLPSYIAEQSDPAAKIYSFSYTIKIENLSPNTVQLLNRHWYVYSANELVAEVEGEGVIGLKPVLSPGQRFDYSSGTEIYDSIGSMRGTYEFINIDTKIINQPDRQIQSYLVEIPQFDLVYPGALN